MEISGKRKRNENNEKEEAEIQKFSEIVEKFRGPYNWFRAGISNNSAAGKNNGGDRKKKEKKAGGNGDEDAAAAADDDDVWMPCFLLQDFEEEEVIKSWKARAVQRSETAAAGTEFESAEGGRVEEKGKEEKLNLRLSL